MKKKNQANKRIISLFKLTENRDNFELFYKSLSLATKGFILCQVLPEERLKIFGFFNSDPLMDRIHVIDMVQPLCGPMELQQSIIDAHEKYGAKKNIFFIYNFESCIYLSKTTAKEFFQQMNLIRDFFMQFDALFVFFVTGSTVKTMIQNAFDFYDWMKFTFTFVQEREIETQTIEIGDREEVKYSEPHKKIEYLKNSIKKTGNEKEKSFLLLGLSTLYRQVGDYDSALERLLESLEIEEKNNALVNMAIRYNEIGLIYRNKGDLDKALESCFKALEIDEKSNNLKNASSYYNNIGMIYKAKGDLDKALEFTFKALEIDEKNNDLKKMATKYNNIGQVYQTKGDLDKALDISFKALEIDQENNDFLGLARDYTNIGAIYQIKGDLDKGLEFGLMALEIDKKINDFANIARDYNNIGYFYFVKGDLDKALEYAFKALEIDEKNNDRVSMVLDYSNIGRIYKAKGDNKTANRYFILSCIQNATYNPIEP
jgi:tetratricopeptide (TPR) repeat protein